MVKEHLSQKKPRLWGLITALVVVILAMVLLGKCSHPAESPFSSALPAKSGGDTLDIAIEISPLSYSLANDTISGLDYDLLREMAAIHGRPIKFHPFAPMEYALRGLEEGSFDIVVSSLPSTSSLKQSLLLTQRVYLDHEVLVQRKDGAKYISEAHSLAGDTVWIAAGSPFISRIRNLGAEIGDTIYIKTDHPYTSEHLAMLVAAGDIPRAVVNAGLAQRIAEADTLLDASTAVSFTQFQTWALHRDNQALCDTLNSWLGDFQATPRYQEQLRHYHLAK